jgi:hypothetical protein
MMTDLPSPAFRPLVRSALVALLVLAAGCGSSSSSTTPPPTTPPGTCPAANVASTCPAAAGAGTDHSGGISTNTTWTAAGSPHRVPFTFTIAEGATLTLEPCATVKLAAGSSIFVAGKLVAAGQAGRPVTIDSSGPGARWGSIITAAAPAWNTGPITTFVDLAYTSLVHGGDTSVGGMGLIDLRGHYSSDPRTAILRVNNVSIDGTSGPDGYGVYLREGVTFTADSTNLTIKNAATRPIRAGDKLVGSIPPGCYTGNAVDEIVWESAADIDQETTIHDRGVPYRLGAPITGNGADMRVGKSGSGAPLTTLTVEAGVTIKVHSPAGRLVMQTSLNTVPGGGYHPSGSLIALGTASKPITFTSAAATPAPGDWVALWFDGGDNSAPASNARLDHVRVEYAGGPTQASGYHCIVGNSYSFDEDSAILMFGPPATQFITNSTIAYSAADGIGRSYEAAPSPDFMSGNTFISVARCKQSYPHPVLPAACPTNPPCP